MKYQTRAFHLSFLLHGLVIAVALILSSHIVPLKKIMVLDFNLQKPKPEVKEVIPPPPPIPAIKTPALKPKPQIVKKEEPPKLQEEKARIVPAPDIPPVVKLPEAQGLESRPMGIGIPDQGRAVKEGSPGSPAGSVGGSKEGSGTSAGLGNPDGGMESARTKYLKEHFSYIRDKVLRNINYPDSARRMGWQGKVLLSFIIAADGSVREFKIIQGSGFPILDKNAVETVKDTAPFPKPPVEAQIVIPIVFRLDT